MRRLLPAVRRGARAAPCGTARRGRPDHDQEVDLGTRRVDGESQFPIYEDLGVGIYQYTRPLGRGRADAPARPANPDDPAYKWPAEVDQAIARAPKHGIEVSLMLIGAPAWANGGRDWRWAPDDPQDFADLRRRRVARATRTSATG